MAKKIIRTCDIVMEVTWLLALVSIPIYFNIYTSRVFEPDKITLFRSLVLVMAVAWAAKILARMAVERESSPGPANRISPRKNRPAETAEIIYPPDGEVIGPDTRPFPRNLLQRPLMLFTFLISFVYILSNVFSVVPGVSWWGSYQRLQGTYSFLSYVVFFLVIAFNMRERRQVERLISFVLLGNIPVALYGLLQHYKADPLPWQGDVTFRITSTMGNAIFISAYLIMVVPLLLYRGYTTLSWLVANRGQARKYFQGRNRDTALSWVVLYGCFMFFLVGLFFVVLNFNANYRPEQVAGVAQAAEAPLLANDTASAESRKLIGNESIGPWWALPVGIILSFGLFFLFTVRRRGTDNNYLFRLFELAGYLTLFIIVTLTTLYSQSRGPLAGILIAVFVFFPLVFWRRKAWRWLGGWLGTGLVAGVILLMFNLPAGSTPLEPVFKIARQNDQVARLGQFLQTNDGTGKVRQLIWKTVLEAVGSAARTEPVRLAVGYGPESLYNVSPQHYQPELAQVEARNAIPDRSHNGYLDALVTTGVLGLVAYLALVLAMIYLGFKLLRRTERFEYQVLLAALISIVIAHQIEIQTGIQIGSTWMMFWTVAGLLVVMAGLVYGRWDAVEAKAVAVTSPAQEILAAEQLAAAEEPEAVAAGSKSGKKNTGAGSNAGSNSKEAAPVRAKGQGKNREKETAGGRPGGVGPRRNAPVYANAFTEPEYGVGNQPVKRWYWGAAGVVAALALALAWFGNIQPILADMVYKQGFNLAQSQQWTRALPYFKQATSLAPSEDYYALYLGQAYLEIAQSRAREAGTDKTKQEGVRSYLTASEAELKRANTLAPLNPDHYANLARLYTRWSDLEPARSREFLLKATGKYDEVLTGYASRNARLWSEQAAASASIATSGLDPEATGSVVDKTFMDKAIAAGEQAVRLDPIYDFSRIVLGDIYRFAKRPAEAGVQYVALAELEPRQVATDQRFVRRMQAIAQSNLVSTEKALEAFNPARYDKPDKTGSNNDKGFAHLGQGIIHFYKNNLDAARQSLTDSISLAPGDPYAHAYMSLVYKRRGQTAQAQTEATQARDLAGKVPQNAQATQAVIEAVLAG